MVGLTQQLFAGPDTVSWGHAAKRFGLEWVWIEDMSLSETAQELSRAQCTHIGHICGHLTPEHRHLSSGSTSPEELRLPVVVPNVAEAGD